MLLELNSPTVVKSLADEAIARPLPSKDPGEIDLNLWIESMRLQIVAEYGEAPATHPSVQILSGWAQKLREAANADPVLQQLGVKLPDEFSVSIIFDQRPNAFVFKEQPEKCYLSVGILEKIKTVEELVMVIAHEQAHIIRHFTLERLKENAPIEPTERFGEKIWKMDMGGSPGSSASSAALDRLGSRAEESWCDTFGTFPYLDKLGISTRATTKLLSHLTPDELEMSRDVDISVSERFAAILHSHPPDAERLWIAQAVGKKIGYPSGLNPTVNFPPHNLEIPVDEKVADFVGRLDALCGYFTSTIVPPSFGYSVDLAKASKIDAQALKQLIDDYPQYMFGIKAAGKHFRNSEDANEEWTFKEIKARGNGQIFRGIKRVLANIVVDSIESDSTPISERLSNHLSELLVGGHSDANSTASASMTKKILGKDIFKAKDLEELVTVFSSLFKSGDLLADRWMNAILKRVESGEIRTLAWHSSDDVTSSDFEKSFGGITTEELKLGIMRISELGSALLRQVKGSLNPVNIYYLAKEECLEIAIDLAKKDQKNKVTTTLDTLLSLSERIDTFATIAGPLFDHTSLGDIAIKYAVDRAGKDLALFESLLLEMRAHGLTPSELPWPSPSMKTNERQTLRDEMIEIVAKCYPTLLGSNHPSALHPFSSFAINHHKERAIRRGILDPHGLIAESFTLEFPSTAEAIGAIEKSGLLLDSASWASFTKIYIHSFDDYEVFKNFIQKRYESHPLEHSAWREKTRNEALFAGINRAFERDSLVNQGTSLSLAEWGVLAEYVKELPRCPMRNQSVNSLIANFPENEDATREIPSLLRLLEVAPIEALALDFTQELRQNGEPALISLESDINYGLQRHPLVVNIKWFENPVTDEDDSRSVNGQLLGAPVTERRSRQDPEEVTGISLDLSLIKAGTYLSLPSVIPLLPIVATPGMIRYTYVQSEKFTEPSSPIPEQPRALRACEEAATSARNLLNIEDPLLSNPFANPQTQSREYFHRYFHEVLELLQPVPTPLRDRWIRHIIDSAQEAGIDLKSRNLRDLQEKCYLPETHQHIGTKLWAQYRQHLESHPESTYASSHALKYLTTVMPLYSLDRNQAIDELRATLGEINESEAIKLSAFVWSPGLPTPIASTNTTLNDSILDLQLTILRSFSDEEQVESILYLGGVTEEKPFAVTYMELVLGGHFDNLRQHQNGLNDDKRLAFLHKAFGGSDGIFSRSDPMAMHRLASSLTNVISAAFESDTEKQALIEDLCKDVVYRAGLASHIRVQLLTSFFSWSAQHRGQEGVDSAQISDLIRLSFSALGAPGTRILQGLVIEPNAFSSEVSQHLRKSQDSVAAGPILTPFHLLRAEGIPGASLGTRRGGGSIAEVTTVSSINGVAIDDVVLKSIRPEVGDTAQNLKAPLKVIAKTLEAHGLRWGGGLVDRVIDSCSIEARLFREEAERTGMPIASIFSRALSSIVHEKGRTIEIATQQGLTVVVPNKVLVQGKTGDEYSFFMGDLGEAFIPFSRIITEEGLDALQTQLSNNSIALSDVSDISATLFVNAFLDENVLFKDLHFGNTGQFASTPGKIGFVDFGSVNAEFPNEEKKWLLSLISAVVSGDQALQKTLLLQSALALGYSRAETEGLVTRAEHIVKTISTALEKSNSTSPLTALEGTLSSVYEEWPLPTNVRDFVEALRKVGREWGPHISQETLSSLGMKIFIASASAVTENSDSEYFKLAREVLTPSSHEQQLEKCDSEYSISALNDLTRFPENTRLYIRETDESNVTVWKEFAIKSSTRVFDSLVEVRGVGNESGYSNTLMRRSLAQKDGYLRFTDEFGLEHLLSLKTAFTM